MLCDCQTTLKNNLRSLVNAHTVVCMMIRIHSMAAVIMSFSLYRWNGLNTFTLNWLQDISKFLWKRKFQHRGFYLALLFSPKFDLHCQKRRALVTWPLGILWRRDLLVANQTTVAGKIHSKASHILYLPCHHPHASIMHPHAYVLHEYGPVLHN